MNLSPIIINLERLPDWFGALPEITLLVFAAAVILLDLFITRKGVLAFVSLIGIIIAGIFSVGFWNANLYFFNDMLRVDNFGVFFKLIFLSVSFILILASKDYVSNFKRFQGEYYAFILLATIGMMLMAATADLISLFISLELTSVSLYVLVSFLKDRKSTEASLKYLLLGAIASAVLLYGMALVFGVTGQTQLTSIIQSITSQGIGTLTTNPALMMGIILMIAGFSFKIAAVPFQMWVPDVYEGAPTTVTAFLSVASKAAGFAIITRIFLTAFFAKVTLAHEWAYIFAGLSVIGMIVGNVAAIPQTNIKRMLAYSSIAQAGYLIVGLAAAGAFTGLESSMPYGTIFAQKGVLFFLAAYAFTNLGAFVAVIIISGKINSDLITDYAGMGKRSPWLALALTLCLVSLIGIPPAAGFMAKFYIFSMAASNGLLWLVVIAVINSVISAYYYLRVVKVMWFSEPASVEKIPTSWAPALALALCSLGVILLGIIPGLLMKLADIAAMSFF
jgi:NADH-quinone oxidoreductase subunit N